MTTPMYRDCDGDGWVDGPDGTVLLVELDGRVLLRPAVYERAVAEGRYGPLTVVDDAPKQVA